jgi:hypothetical protein
MLTAKEPAPPVGLRLEVEQTGSVSNTLCFSTETLKVSSTPWLTATQGQINITCRMPTNWPVADDMMIFHTQSKSHVHITLFFRNASLYAVYKGGKEFFASVKLAESAIWKADSRHRIQFGWKPAKDDFGEDLPKDVKFVLLVDGKLAESSYGRVMEPWPELCEIGGRNNKDLWTGGIESVTLSPAAIQLAEVMPDLKAGERTITVNANQEIGPCYRFWTVANCNGPHRFLKPGHIEGKKRGQPFISQINAVYLLGGPSNE